MATCDLCGERCNLSDMTSLLSQYQVNGVVDICPSCEKWSNKQKRELLDVIPQQMRNLIAYKKSAIEGKPVKVIHKRYKPFCFF